MSQRLQARLDEGGRVEVDPGRGDVLHRVRLLRAAEGRVDRWLTDAISEARQAGFSWADIGEVLGVSRQAAWEAYRDRMRPAVEETRHGSGLSEEQADALAVAETRAARKRRRR